MENCKFRSSSSLGAATCLLLLTVSLLGRPTSARVLDEALPMVAPAAPLDPPAEPAPLVTPPAAVTVETPTVPPQAETPVAATVPPPVPPTTVGATADAGGAAGDRTLSFFLHDIVSGSVFLVNGGVPNKADNGNGNNNNLPFPTGLSGTATGVVQNNGDNVGNGGVNGLPFFTGGNLPAGTTLQKLPFGTMTVIDDKLTEGQEMGSSLVGKAQGFYIVSSEDGTCRTMAFTAMFKEGEYADSLCFFGVHRTADSESHVAVVGGTGKYVNAKGYATLQMLPPVDHTDGVETLLQIQVNLTY